MAACPSWGKRGERGQHRLWYHTFADISLRRPPPPPQGGSGVHNDSEKETSSETSLVRAIQAAQQARGGGGTKDSIFSSRSYTYSAAGDTARTWRMDGPPPGSSTGGGGGGGGESTAAAVLALHMVWVALEAASEALLPLWMLSPGKCLRVVKDLGWAGGVGSGAAEQAAGDHPVVFRVFGSGSGRL